MEDKNNPQVPNIAMQAIAALAVMLFVMIVNRIVDAGKLEAKPLLNSGQVCVRGTPDLKIHNTYEWAKWGSYAKPGQRVPYAMTVVNNDSKACGVSNFMITPNLPAGFTQDVQIIKLTVPAGEESSQILAFVESPKKINEGDYEIGQSLWRNNNVAVAAKSLYKVYSTDRIKPIVVEKKPQERMLDRGMVELAVSSRDDRIVRKIETYIDGKLTKTSVNEGVAYGLTAEYEWNTLGLQGSHVVMYKVYDDSGNTASAIVNYYIK